MFGNEQKLGCLTTYNNKEVVEKSEVVILAVKPGQISSVLREISNDVSNKHLIVSLASSIPLSAIELVSLLQLHI